MHKPIIVNPQPARRASSTYSIFYFALIFALSLGSHGCTERGTRNDSNNNAQAQATPLSSTSPTPTSTSPEITFDGERAIASVRTQVEMGPRPAGSEELARTRDYLVSELKSYGLNVSLDEFHPSTPVGERKMVNIIAELPGESGDIIMVTSHYDTKLYKKFRFVGANDAGSSTGVLLELARVLAAGKEKRPFTYRFVFFDGEEAFCENWDECGKPNAPDNTYGSHRYVAQLKEKNEVQRVRAMILLDMIGYKYLAIPRESMSTPWLTNIIWRTARETGHAAQFPDNAESVEDDHQPFLEAGIESVDLIQLSGYPYWHTFNDTLDKISPQSLQIVGDVLLASLPRIEEHLKK